MIKKTLKYYSVWIKHSLLEECLLLVAALEMGDSETPSRAQRHSKPFLAQSPEGIIIMQEIK